MLPRDLRALLWVSRRSSYAVVLPALALLALSGCGERRDTSAAGVASNASGSAGAREQADDHDTVMGCLLDAGFTDPALRTRDFGDTVRATLWGANQPVPIYVYAYEKKSSAERLARRSGRGATTVGRFIIDSDAADPAAVVASCLSKHPQAFKDVDNRQQVDLRLLRRHRGSGAETAAAAALGYARALSSGIPDRLCDLSSAEYLVHLAQEQRMTGTPACSDIMAEGKRSGSTPGPTGPTARSVRAVSDDEFKVRIRWTGTDSWGEYVDNIITVTQFGGRWFVLRVASDLDSR